jgi:hypothetical protein
MTEILKDRKIEDKNEATDAKGASPRNFSVFGLVLRSCCRNWIFPSGWSVTLLGLWAALLLFDFAKHGLILGADPPPPQLDAFEYWRQGGQLASGDWLLQNELGAFRTPGYPAFLAPFHLFGRYGLLMAFGVQHLLVMATSLMTAAVCGRITGRSGATVVAYAISAMCYSRDWHANLILSENLFTFLLMAIVATTVHYFARPSAYGAAAIGFLIGLATLVRPISTYLWVPIGAAMATVLVFGTYAEAGDGRPRRGMWAVTSHLAMIVLAVYVALTPWLLRNQVLFGSPFMTRFLGRNLWVVTFEEQSGAGLTLGDGPASSELKEHLERVDVPVAMDDTWSVSAALTASGLPDDEIDALMLRVCRELILNSPETAAYKTIRRTLNFWRCVSNPFPFYEWNPDQADDRGQYFWRSPSATAAYARMNRFAASRSLRLNELALVLVIIGSTGLFRRPETRSLAIALVLILLYFNVVTAVLEIPSYRYRLILEPIMIACLASGAFAWFFPARPLLWTGDCPTRTPIARRNA